MNSKRAKIAFYLSGHEKGGSSYSTAMLIKNLYRDAFETLTICNEKGIYYDSIKAYSDHVCVLGIGKPRQMQIIQGKNWRYNKLAVMSNLRWFIQPIRILIKLFKQNNIDIVHSNGGYLGLIAGLAAKASGVKSIWHCRGLLSDNVPARLFLGPLGFLAAKCTDCFIGISRAVVNSMPLGWRNKAVVVYNGIDFCDLDSKADPLFLRDHIRMRNKESIIGIAGSIIPIKGHTDFIETAKLLRANYPNALFVIIGSAPKSSEAYYRQLHGLVESYGLGDSFQWMGNIPNARQYLGGLDVLVSCTIPPGEGFGLTLIEAMGQGVPVVVTSCGASLELVRDGKSGFIVPPKQPAKMSEAVANLLKNQDLRKKMGSYAQTWSRGTFHIKKTSRNVERIYNELLGL